MKPILTQPYNESALLCSLQSNNAKAFEELYDRFAPNLLSVIFHIVHDESQAQDLLQDSFVKIWCNLHKYDPSKARLFTWMLTIVRNTTFSYLQTSRHTCCCINEVSVETIGVTTPSYQTIGLTYWVNSILSGNELRMINLMYFQGYTFQEISDEFGLPLGSVKTYIRRALQRLRNNI
jgi:RNA polymerase sigma-70 factor (ECF subfamily)